MSVYSAYKINSIGNKKKNSSLHLLIETHVGGHMALAKIEYATILSVLPVW